MRKWIMLALINWLRKPANRQKAKDAWNKYREIAHKDVHRTGRAPRHAIHQCIAPTTRLITKH